MDGPLCYVHSRVLKYSKAQFPLCRWWDPVPVSAPISHPGAFSPCQGIQAKKTSAAAADGVVDAEEDFSLLASDECLFR